MNDLLRENGKNDYEAERARRIAENKSRMEQLGLVQASQALMRSTKHAQIAQGTIKPPRRVKARKPRATKAAPAAPPRASKRLKGWQALDPELAAAVATEEVRVEEAGADAGDAVLGYTTKGSLRKGPGQLSLDSRTTFAAPFTLSSINTTIWELGSIHRGAWAQRYWSSRNCLYHHAYPVGYRATKVVFGRTYEMRISAGPLGPVFSVQDTEGGPVFQGSSPTKPWTEVCIAHRTGQRISGPQYFGFSDPVTHKAIATCLYNERELAAALAGDRLEAENLSPEEIAAKEIMNAVAGVGEKVASVLANTVALGGVKHSGWSSLKAWVGASEDNMDSMKRFLLTSEEMPPATQRWAPWQWTVVPNFLKALTEEAKENSVKQEAAEEEPCGDTVNVAAPTPFEENIARGVSYMVKLEEGKENSVKQEAQEEPWAKGNDAAPALIEENAACAYMVKLEAPVIVKEEEGGSFETF